MKYLLSMFAVVLALGTLIKAQAQTTVSADELVKWNFYGTGIAKIDHKQVYMSEAENSVGAMLVSPENYPADVVMRYELMPLTAATVCVAMLNVHDSDDFSYSVPKQYNGYVQHWTQDMNGYFFAFHNASHNWTPFLQKAEVVKDMAVKMDIADENVMQVGKYYRIEIGKKDSKIWLKVDGKTVLEANDSAPFKGGHLALRIRGTAWNKASCLIRKLTIE